MTTLNAAVDLLVVRCWCGKRIGSPDHPRCEHIHGVCPVQNCGRSFANVQRHLDQQHPQWVTEHAHDEVALT